MDKSKHLKDRDDFSENPINITTVKWYGLCALTVLAYKYDSRVNPKKSIIN